MASASRVMGHIPPKANPTPADLVEQFGREVMRLQQKEARVASRPKRTRPEVEADLAAAHDSLARLEVLAFRESRRAQAELAVYEALHSPEIPGEADIASRETVKNLVIKARQSALKNGDELGLEIARHKLGYFNLILQAERAAMDVECPLPLPRPVDRTLINTHNQIHYKIADLEEELESLGDVVEHIPADLDANIERYTK